MIFVVGTLVALVVRGYAAIASFEVGMLLTFEVIIVLALLVWSFFTERFVRGFSRAQLRGAHPASGLTRACS